MKKTNYLAIYFLLLLLSCFNPLESNAEVTAPTELAGGVSSGDIETVKTIFRKFTTVIGTNADDYTLEIHKNDELNAYATLGKKIVINSALIEQTKSEAGLAFVIAHELGHVQEKHVIKSMLRSSFSGAMKYFVFKENKLLNGIDYFHSLYYSRDHESDADIYAVNLINKTYCKVPGKLEFFQKINAAQPSPKVLEYFSTHPLPQSRIDYLTKEIKNAGCVL